jgi:glycosyltransferase involved in cell wall biosynthesis
MRRVLIIQRVPAAYRESFFQKLASKVDLVVIAGSESRSASEKIREFGSLKNATFEKTDIRYFLNGSVWFDMRWLKNVKKHSPEVVVITPTPRMLSNYLLIAYCKVKKISITGFGMGKMPGLIGFRARIHLFILRTLLYGLDSMICYSSIAKKYYVSAGMRDDVCFVAHNSIDTDEAQFNYKKFISDKNIINTVNMKYNLSDSSYKVVFVGRLIKDKQIDKLIIACCINNVELIIVGDGVEMDNLKSLSHAYNKNVFFVGYKDGIELGEILFTSNLFVLPSLGGLAINHAMAYGLPVLVSEGDGTEEDLVNGNGEIFTRLDWVQMKELIIKMLSSDNLDAMGDESRYLISSKFNIDSMVNVFIDEVERL